MRNRIILISALLLASCAPPRPAVGAQSYLDATAEAVAAEVTELFTAKLEAPAGGKSSVALYQFKDLTGKFQPDAQLLRKLLFGKLTIGKRFKPAGMTSFDAAFAEAFPSKTLDDLEQEQLTRLWQKTGATYVLSAKIAMQDGRPALQVFVYDAEKGILLFTPVFPFDAKPSAAPPAQVEKPKPDGTQKTPAVEKVSKPAVYDMTPGKFNFFTGALPKSPAIDFLPVNLDADPKPEVIFLTTDSMDIVKLSDNKASEYWKNQYKKSFPLRGLTGAIFSKAAGGKPALFVSMNVFSGSIVYLWENDNPVKKLNLDHFVAYLDPRSGAALMADYGKGRLSYNGGASFLAESPASESGGKFGYKLPDDYYSGCVAEWSNTGPELTMVATVDEGGSLKVYRGGKAIADSGPRAGSTLDCWKSGATGNIYFVTSTNAGGKDAALLFVLRKKGAGYTLDKAWSSAQFEGALTRARFFDLDGDGRPEIMGMIAKSPGAAPKLFYVSPTYAKEDMQ